jgi:hypothetical protein
MCADTNVDQCKPIVISLYEEEPQRYGALASYDLFSFYIVAAIS